MLRIKNEADPFIDAILLFQTLC